MTALKHIVRMVLLAIRDALDPLLNFREVAVLCYHSISESAHATAITPEVFAGHLDMLRDRGYTFVPLADVVAFAHGGKQLPRKAVALTFDDGYADFVSTVAPLLQQRSIPAALFVMHAPAEEWDAPLLAPADVELLKSNPLVEVGYHSNTHPNLARCTEAQVVEEVSPRYGARYFAYPGGNHSARATDAVRKAGYEAAFTIRPVLVRQGMDPHLLPRSVVTREMSARTVAFYASRAADWYRVLKTYG